MNKKIIRKRQDSWYNKRYPWNLVDDLAVYLRDSLRGYILCLENCDDQILGKTSHFLIPNDIIDKFDLKEDMNPRKVKLYILKRMYYSFDQVARDYPDSPWNIWWEKNCAGRSWNIKKDGRFVYSTPAIPDDVRRAQEKYCDDIDVGIKLYVKFLKSISSESTCIYAAYLSSLNKKTRWRQLEKLDSNLSRIGAFDDDQAWYIYEGLVAFKNSKRMGHPGYTAKEDWEKYLDAMIFTAHEVVFQNETLYDYDEDKEDYHEKCEEYWKKYNEGKKLFGKYFLDLWD